MSLASAPAPATASAPAPQFLLNINIQLYDFVQNELYQSIIEFKLLADQEVNLIHESEIKSKLIK